MLMVVHFEWLNTRRDMYLYWLGTTRLARDGSMPCLGSEESHDNVDSTQLSKISLMKKKEMGFLWPVGEGSRG